MGMFFTFIKHLCYVLSNPLLNDIRTSRMIINKDSNIVDYILIDNKHQIKFFGKLCYLINTFNLFEILFPIQIHWHYFIKIGQLILDILFRWGYNDIIVFYLFEPHHAIDMHLFIDIFRDFSDHCTCFLDVVTEDIEVNVEFKETLQEGWVAKATMNNKEFKNRLNHCLLR